MPDRKRRNPTAVGAGRASETSLASSAGPSEDSNFSPNVQPRQPIFDAAAMPIIAKHFFGIVDAVKRRCPMGAVDGPRAA